MKSQIQIRVAVTAVMVAVALSMVFSTVRPASTYAANVHVDAFYTISRQAYNGWHNGSHAPVKTTAFAAGTVDVGYYFAFSGAAAGVTKFQIIQYSPDGSSSKGAVHTLTRARGVFLDFFQDPPAFAPGQYRYALLVNGKQVAVAAFSIHGGIVVPYFYPISRSALVAWSSSNTAPDPNVTRVFPVATVSVAYFFGYAGTTPKVSYFQVIVYNSLGKPVAQGTTHTMSYNAGYYADFINRSPLFANGIYTMKLLINGKVAKSISFRVGA